MIWIVSLVLVGLLVWKAPSIKWWCQEKKFQLLCSWAMKHKDELPIEPIVTNAGEWIKVEEDTVAPKDGIAFFICMGDNHLFYEIHTILNGTKLVELFQGDNIHIDGCFRVKPLYYYYIPFCIVNDSNISPLYDSTWKG